MKSGICQICHKPFKLTKFGKLCRHGYKYEIHKKKWTGFWSDLEIYEVHYKLTKQPCAGSSLPPVALEEREGL